MTQNQLVTVILDLIGKNSTVYEDRFNIPLMLLITASKINDIPKEQVLIALSDSWDDVKLIIENKGDSESIKH